MPLWATLSSRAAPSSWSAKSRPLSLSRILWDDHEDAARSFYWFWTTRPWDHPSPQVGNSKGSTHLEKSRPLGITILLHAAHHPCLSGALFTHCNLTWQVHTDVSGLWLALWSYVAEVVWVTTVKYILPGCERVLVQTPVKSVGRVSKTRTGCARTVVITAHSSENSKGSTGPSKENLSGWLPYKSPFREN